ncbi:hypothetical protein [Amycolatopsis sp. NPDC098790]|uniref:hypothetical protein n=1 Tax=Amycolatopsis sp. NPDC098790 TaxID=3363939 RepID=UPI00382C661F
MAKLPDDSPFPFRGRVVWLTAEQGGRTTGPPRADTEDDYMANAFVPPRTADSGLASFVLRDLSPGAVVSPAAGCWLVVGNSGPYRIQAGTVVVITEGPRTVGYFHVDEVR